MIGILNVTPDSFSDGGDFATVEAAVNEARAMQAAGALMIDIGGESTRPGASPVSADEEIRRVLPVVEALAAQEKIIISVDTQKADVARAALSAGAHLINDVSGLRDPEMRIVCAEAVAPAVIMHRKGDPQTMQKNPVYADVVSEVAAFLERQAEQALADGVPDVMIDPGLGFGKTLEHNLALLRALPELCARKRLVLVGASRKRMIDYLADVPEAKERDPGSIAIHLYAARCGAALVRVHNVAAHVQALRVQEALL